MLVKAISHHYWSRVSLRVDVLSLAMCVVLSLLHGLLRLSMGNFATSPAQYDAYVTWATDFRYLFEQLLFVAATGFVGSRFLETRALFSVGFDKADASRMLLTGPDADNVVWIGHRYATATEAQTVADAFAERLKPQLP